MKCSTVMEWIPRYMDRTLSPQADREMMRHIGTCPACARWLEETRELEAIWKEMESGSALEKGMDDDLPDLVLPVMAAIDRLEAGKGKAAAESPAGRRSVLRSSWIHYGLAACLTFVLVQFGVFEHLGYGLTEMNIHMSSSVTELLGASQSH